MTRPLHAEILLNVDRDSGIAGEVIQRAKRQNTEMPRSSTSPSMPLVYDIDKGALSIFVPQATAATEE